MSFKKEKESYEKCRDCPYCAVIDESSCRGYCRFDNHELDLDDLGCNEYELSNFKEYYKLD